MLPIGNGTPDVPKYEMSKVSSKMIVTFIWYGEPLVTYTPFRPSRHKDDDSPYVAISILVPESGQNGFLAKSGCSTVYHQDLLGRSGLTTGHK
eukprot:scaffold29536_cov76-Amphora_coffeaeformis.AAC.1